MRAWSGGDVALAISAVLLGLSFLLPDKAPASPPDTAQMTSDARLLFGQAIMLKEPNP